MPRLSMKVKLSKKDSDSDESFHCCGRPEDLINDPPTPTLDASISYKEVMVPENQEYYCYQSGIERQKVRCHASTSSQTPPLSAQRTRARPYSLNSQKTVVGECLLVIKTDFGPSQNPSASIHVNPDKGECSKPLKPRVTPGKLGKLAHRTSSIQRNQNGKTVTPRSPGRVKLDKTRFSALKTAWRSSKIPSTVNEAKKLSPKIQDTSENSDFEKEAQKT